MDHFQIEFNVEEQVWELIDTEDWTEVMDANGSLDALHRDYPTIQIILPKGEMNVNLEVNA